MEWILDHPEAFLMFLGGILSFVVWNIRQEGKHSALKEVVRLEHEACAARFNDLENSMSAVRAKQDGADSRIAEELKGIQIKLATIQGFLQKGSSNGV